MTHQEAQLYLDQIESSTKVILAFPVCNLLKPVKEAMDQIMIARNQLMLYVEEHPDASVE